MSCEQHLQKMTGVFQRALGHTSELASQGGRAGLSQGPSLGPAGPPHSAHREAEPHYIPLHSKHDKEGLQPPCWVGRVGRGLQVSPSPFAALKFLNCS